MTNPLVTRGAVFDETGTYRYRLWREWDEGKCRVCFVLLNPSVADAERDDPTLRRCMGFARAWGYGGLEVVNLFAFRATHPAKLKRAAHPVGPNNDRVICEAQERAALVVVGWGMHGNEDRVHAVYSLLSKPVCLGYTKQGHPRHPLYVPGTASPIPFARRESCAR